MGRFLRHGVYCVSVYADVWKTVPTPARTSSTDFMIGRFLPSISVFWYLVFIPLLFLFIGSVRQIKLAVRQLLGARKHIVYRIVSFLCVQNVRTLTGMTSCVHTGQWSANVWTTSVSWWSIATRLVLVVMPTPLVCTTVISVVCFLLPPPRRICNRRCPFVCLSVSN